MNNTWRYFNISILWLCFIFPFVFSSKQPNFTDWQVYVTAGNKFINGQGVYDVVGHYQFKYAPSVAAVFAFLLSLFSSDLLKWVNYFASLGVALCFLFKALDLSKQESTRKLSSFLWSLLFVVSFSLPLRDELKLGQVNVWVLLLLFGFWKYRDSRNVIWPALCWSLAISLKLYALIFVPVLVFKRKWRLLFSTASLFCILNYLLPLFWITSSQSLAQNIEWLRTLTQSSSELLGSHYDVSLLGILVKLGLGKSFAVSFWVLMLGAFLVWTFKVSHCLMFLDRYYFGFALCWIYLLNPLVWPYWCFFLAPYLARCLFVDGVGLGLGMHPDRRFLLGILSALLLVMCHRNDTPLALLGSVAFLLLVHQFFFYSRFIKYRS
jgi:hypothetical protein